MKSMERFETFLSKNGEALGLVVAILFVIGLLGFFFWLGYTGRYKPKSSFSEIVNPQPVRVDTLSLGVVRSVEFTTATSSSMPIIAGIPVGGGGFLLPIGGGTSSDVFSLVTTDSSSFMVKGSVALRVGREAKVFKRSRGTSTVALPRVDGTFVEYGLQ